MSLRLFLQKRGGVVCSLTMQESVPPSQSLSFLNWLSEIRPVIIAALRDSHIVFDDIKYIIKSPIISL